MSNRKYVFIPHSGNTGVPLTAREQKLLIAEFLNHMYENNVTKTLSTYTSHRRGCRLAFIPDLLSADLVKVVYEEYTERIPERIIVWDWLIKKEQLDRQLHNARAGSLSSEGISRTFERVSHELAEAMPGAAYRFTDALAREFCDPEQDVWPGAKTYWDLVQEERDATGHVHLNALHCS